MSEKVTIKVERKKLHLPTIALRGLVVFPNNLVHFEVGREKSIAAVEWAMANNSNVFLVAQKSMDTTEPQQFRLRDALDEVATNDVPYDYCIMDCPPDLDMGSINALCAADWVIIPVDCDEWACDGMREIVDQIERVQMYYNPHLKIMGALMTKYRRTRYAAEVVHQLNDAGVEMLGTVIRYTIKVSEAKSAHKPLRAYRPDCSAATDYGCLADEVEEIVSRMDTKEG